MNAGICAGLFGLAASGQVQIARQNLKSPGKDDLAGKLLFVAVSVNTKGGDFSAAVLMQANVKNQNGRTIERITISIELPF